MFAIGRIDIDYFIEIFIITFFLKLCIQDILGKYSNILVSISIPEIKLCAKSSIHYKYPCNLKRKKSLKYLK